MYLAVLAVLRGRSAQYGVQSWIEDAQTFAWLWPGR
jgi:hypothetical protein